MDFNVSQYCSIKSYTDFRVPTHLENLENLENENVNFQAWKSPGKKMENVLEKSWKCF